MRHLTFLSAIFVAAISFGQDTIPKAVTAQITDDTLAVIRIDAKSLDVDLVTKVLQDWPNPTGPEAARAGALAAALRKLKPLSVDELFFVMESTDLPINGLLVVPTSNQSKVHEAMKSIWSESTLETAGAVVAGNPSVLQRVRTSKAASRPEFAAGLNATTTSTVQVVIAPGNDARRVIREFLPTLPPELGGGSTAMALDGTQWVAVGMSPPPKVEVRLIAQTKDAATGQALDKFIASMIGMAINSNGAKELLPEAGQLQDLLTPKRKVDQLILELNEANGGAKKLMEKVAGPLTRAVRENADRSRVVNSLKQLALAMHNYHDANKTFPPSYSVAEDGANLKLLSWRVLILPFVAEGDLYKQFHLDEPWDSAHNKALIAKMPDIYVSSKMTAEQKRQGMTGFVVPTGPKSVFADHKSTKISEITDGTSNTIMIIDAPDKATIWTRPDDLPFDPNDPSSGLNKSFWAAFCDGGVRRIMDVTPQNLLRYLQMNDGEVVEQ